MDPSAKWGSVYSLFFLQTYTKNNFQGEAVYVIKAIAIYTHNISSDQHEIMENSMNSTLERIFSDRNSSGDETWKYCNHAIT